MTDDFIRFRRPETRPEVYLMALELSAKLYAVIELAELERFFLRDQLDRKSTAIPVAIAQGLATPHMHERRQLYRKASKGVVDVRAILDVLDQRGTVDRAAIAAARDVALALVARLDTLVIEPPVV